MIMYLFFLVWLMEYICFRNQLQKKQQNNHKLIHYYKTINFLDQFSVCVSVLASMCVCVLL